MPFAGETPVESQDKGLGTRFGWALALLGGGE